MELKLYLLILLRRWKIVVAALIVTMIPTVFLVMRQPIIYEAKAVYIIRPSSSLTVAADDSASLIETLSRRVEINSTYARIASSNLIEERAADRLGLTSSERSGLKADSKAVTGQNILEIIASGRDPVVVASFANAVGEETARFVSTLYETFELEALDRAAAPKRPASPNLALDLAAGAIIGLFIGVALVFAIEYLRGPVNRESTFDILDPTTGAYNRPYFMLRLHEEISRAELGDRVFALALIKIGSDRTEALTESSVASLLLESIRIIRTTTRPHDVVAYLGQSTFAILMPEQGAEAARVTMKTAQEKIEFLAPEELVLKSGFTRFSAIGITVYESSALSVEALLLQAAQALEVAEHVNMEKLTVYSTSEMLRPAVSYVERPRGPVKPEAPVASEPKTEPPRPQPAVSAAERPQEPVQTEPPVPTEPTIEQLHAEPPVPAAAETKQKQPSNGPTLTRKELAEQLGISASTIGKHERQFKEFFASTKIAPGQPKRYPEQEQQVLWAIHNLRKQGYSIKELKDGVLKQALENGEAEQPELNGHSA